MKESRSLTAALSLVLVAAALLAGCSGTAQPKAPPAATQSGQVVTISTKDLLTRLQGGEKPLIIDVREPYEFDAGHIEGAKLIPLGTVAERIGTYNKNQEIILVCRSGNRSEQAYQLLTKMGYTNLKNVTGGMLAWEQINGPIKK